MSGAILVAIIAAMPVLYVIQASIDEALHSLIEHGKPYQFNPQEINDDR